VHRYTVRESRRNQNIPPVLLRDFHRATQLFQIPVAQLQCCETNALEIAPIGLFLKWQVAAALSDEQVGCLISVGAGEKRVDATSGFRAQLNVCHNLTLRGAFIPRSGQTIAALEQHLDRIRQMLLRNMMIAPFYP
jgi:hypothetical protein